MRVALLCVVLCAAVLSAVAVRSSFDKAVLSAEAALDKALMDVDVTDFDDRSIRAMPTAAAKASSNGARPAGKGGAKKHKKKGEVAKAHEQETLKLAKLPARKPPAYSFNAIGLAPNHAHLHINASDPTVVALFKSVEAAWNQFRSLSFRSAVKKTKGLHTVSFGYDYAKKRPLVTLRFKPGKAPKKAPKALKSKLYGVAVVSLKNALGPLSSAPTTPAAPGRPAPAHANLTVTIPGLNLTRSAKSKKKRVLRTPVVRVGETLSRHKKKKQTRFAASAGMCLRGFTKKKGFGDYLVSTWHGRKKLNKLVRDEFFTTVGVVSAVNPKGYRKDADVDLVYMHKLTKCQCSGKAPGYKVFKNRAALAGAVVYLASKHGHKRVDVTSLGRASVKARKGFINPRRIFESSKIKLGSGAKKSSKKRPKKSKKKKAQKKKKKSKKDKKKKKKKSKDKKKKKKKQGKKKDKQKKKSGKKDKKKKDGKKSDKNKDAKDKKDGKVDAKSGNKTANGTASSSGSKDLTSKLAKDSAPSNSTKPATKPDANGDSKKTDKKKKDKKKKDKKKKDKKKKDKKKKDKKKKDKKKKKEKPVILHSHNFIRVQYPVDQEPKDGDSGGPLYFHDVLLGVAAAGDKEGANFSPIWAVNNILPSHLKYRFC